MNDRSAQFLRSGMKTTTRQLRRCITISVLTLLALGAGVGSAGQTAVKVNGRITYEVQDGVYVNVGTDGGLVEGLVGTLQLEDGRTAQFEVLHAARQSALLRLVGYPRTERLLDRSVEIAFEPRSTEQAAAPRGGSDQAKKEAATSPAVPGTPDTREFVPLLAPVRRTPEVSAPQSVSHGRIELRQLLQTDSENDLGYSTTRLRSSGAMERIAGSPWSFSWSGDMRYRTGDALQNHPDYQEVHPDFYRLMFQRPIEDGGFLRLGRFVPVELPGIGYVDGVQGETRRGEGLRFGAIAGLKPDRVDLDASADEPLVAGYATVEAGRRDGPYYSGTVGLLNSYYRGEVDRLAVLMDQRAGLGPGLTLYSTAAVDLNAGTTQTRDGIRLTQLDVFAESRLSSFLGLRAGVDHWERPDIQAERDLLVFEDERFFDDGYWRYWVGSYQNLPWSFQLYEEVSLIDADNTGNSTRYQVRLTRTGLFGMRNASASVTAYTLAGNDTDGYGCRVSGYFPLNDGRLSMQPAAGFRTLQTGSQAEDISLTYLSLYLDGRLSKAWTLFGGVNYSDGDGVDSTLIEVGLRYSW